MKACFRALMVITALLTIAAMAGPADAPATAASDAPSWFLKYGSQLSQIGVCGILGAALLYCLMVLRKIYAEKEAAYKQYMDMVTGVVAKNTTVIQEVTDVIRKCGK